MEAKRMETNGYTFLWKIANISHCWLKTGEEIDSPVFIAKTLYGSKWSLKLYPRGKHDTSTRLYLHRKPDCSGPDVIAVNYQLAFLGKNGSFLGNVKAVQYAYCKNYLGSGIHEEIEKVFTTEKDTYMPEDTLTLQCTLWKREETLVKSKHFSAHTVFRVHRRSFVWKIAEFNSLKPGIRNSYKDDLITFDLILKEGIDLLKSLVIVGMPVDKSIKYFSFKTSILDSEGKKEDCGTHEYLEDDLVKGVSSTVLFCNKVMENKSLYLSNDVLSLECEYASSNGSILYEHSGCDTFSLKLKSTDVGKRSSTKQEIPQYTSDLVDDLKSMYKDATSSDTKLRTSTKTFPAHKGILSVRSPVFRKMFSIDMKETNCGYIDITDLDDDTIHRMLLYIYSDSLEDLQFENASKLYVAADKYEILSLRNRCSSFLIANLSPTNACDVLTLADRHQDDDLKSGVQDFILRHDGVFDSQEWKHLMATNIQLAADVMYRKICPC